MNTMIDLSDAPIVCFMNINRYEYKCETDIGIRAKFPAQKNHYIVHVIRIEICKSKVHYVCVVQ